MNHFDNIKRAETAILFGLVLSLAIVSWLFIYSFGHIPLTNVTGGEEPLYALVGGVALAFSVPTLPLLALYLTVLFTAGKGPSELDGAYKIVLVPATLFLLSFGTAFVIAISGVPYGIASAVYKGRAVINLIGGLLLAFYGLKALNESGFIPPLRFTLASKSERSALLEAPLLGLMAGLLLFHHLDPPYDSVFFVTGRAGAFSHHPFVVGFFGTGLSVMYFALAYSFSPLIVSGQSAKVTAWLRVALGVLTLILGFSLATGMFPSLTALIPKGH